MGDKYQRWDRYTWDRETLPDRYADRIIRRHDLRLVPSPGGGLGLYLPDGWPARAQEAQEGAVGYDGVLAHLDVGVLAGEPPTIEALERVAASLPKIAPPPLAIAVHPADRLQMRETTEPGHLSFTPPTRVYFNPHVARGKVWATDHEVYAALFDPEVMVARLGSLAQSFAEMMNSLDEEKAEGDGERGEAGAGEP